MCIYLPQTSAQTRDKNAAISSNAQKSRVSPIKEKRSAFFGSRLQRRRYFRRRFLSYLHKNFCECIVQSIRLNVEKKNTCSGNKFQRPFHCITFRLFYFTYAFFLGLLSKNRFPYDLSCGKRVILINTPDASVGGVVLIRWLQSALIPFVTTQASGY